jgi:hypothetical protein
MISSIKGFITERPHDYAGVVLVSIYGLVSTVDIGRFPSWIVGCPACRIPSSLGGLLDIWEVAELHWDRNLIYLTETMTFKVALVHDPETKFVCEIIEPRVVDLMGSPDGIDVVCLHE